MGKRGRAQGAYVNGPERILVSEARATGALLEWRGTFGWIQPSEPVEHPQAAKNRGKVYLSQEDVAEDLPGLGALVSFLVYADSNGVGACDCRVAEEEEEEDAEDITNGDWYTGGGRKGAAKGAAWRRGGGLPAPAARAPGGARGQWQAPDAEPMEGTVAQWKGEFGWIRPDQPLDGRNGGNLYFSVDDVVAEISGVGAPVTFTPYHGPQGLSAGNVGPAEARGEQDHGEVLGQVHAALHEGVWAAVQLAGNVEPDWTPEEMSKRLVRYLYKGAHSPDLIAMPWREAVQRYLDRAMQSYTSACGDRPWFLDLDLTQAVGAAAWALVRSSPLRPRPQRAEVMQLAMRGFLDRVHRSRLDKAMWEVLEATFEADQSVLSKVYGFLSRAYDAALASISEDTRPVKGLKRAETFFKQWMNDSMSRTWTALPDPESFITEETVSWLFECLLHPFGQEDPFCCIPSWLLGDARRAPRGWSFIRPATQALFRSWSMPGPPAKRKKRRQPDGEWEAGGEALEGSADGMNGGDLEEDIEVLV